MLRKVPSGQAQCLEQVSELHAACLVNEAKDAKAGPLMNDFVKTLRWMRLGIIDGVRNHAASAGSDNSSARHPKTEPSD